MLDKNDLFEIKKKKKKNGHSKIIIGGLVYYAPNKSGISRRLSAKYRVEC